MATTRNNTAPGWFTLITILALIWNVAGLAYWWSEVSMSVETFARLPEVRQALAASKPTWAGAMFALMVISGTIGALLLVLRKSLGGAFLQLSLAGAVAHLCYLLFLTRALDVLGPVFMVTPVLAVVVGLALVLIAFKANSVGWTS